MWYEEVTEFIKRRFGDFPKEYWTQGNCYYFAIILKERFKYLEIYYDPVDGHFLAGYGSYFFDIVGCRHFSTFENIIPLEEIKIGDPNWYERLMEDCVK